MKENELAITIAKAAQSLHNAIRYIYSISISDLYNVNVKDLFQISLSDINNPSILSVLGLSLSPIHSSGGASIFKGDEFAKLEDVIHYAFAVRIPFLRRDSAIKIKDKFLHDVFNACVENGASDKDNVIEENLEGMLKLSKGSRDEPPFNGEWFRRWVYLHGGELAAINNRNMFLFGCMDTLLPLFYAKLYDVLKAMLPTSA